MKDLLKKYYAKSDPAITIFEHNEDLKDRYYQLRPYLPKEKVERYEEVIIKIIEYHDLGKINKKFQNKITGSKRESDEIPHEWLSVAFVNKELRKWLKTFNHDYVNFYTLFCYVIAYHHTRSKDFSIYELNNAIISDMPEEIPNSFLTNNYDVENDFNYKVNEYFSDYFEDLVFFKGILHKCDYSASAGIEAEQSYCGYYKTDFSNGLKNKIITLRPFQANAVNLSDKSVVLIASTGIGKTEYSMNWANGGKIFYLLGIKIAVNAMYERFKAFFKDNVSLLHGDINYMLVNDLDDTKDYDFKLAKARQFSYPITIATADQLIASVFKFNSFEMYYLTASYSRIIVDEIQSFSPETIACIVVFLQEVSKLGAKFLVMSATIPPFIKKEFEKVAYFEEPQLLDIKRHKIEVKDCLIEDYDLSDIDFNNQKVLIIVNTVKKAQLIYEKLTEKGFKSDLLHSRFIRIDRKKKEDKILKFAKNNDGGVWITTQIVEASLDIDFDFLLTECSTIDSMLQRFGRCYRQRDYNKPQSNIFIFKYDSISKKVYDPELLERTYKVISQYNGLLLTEKQKQDMINKVFDNIEYTRYYQAYNDYKQLLKSGFRSNKSEAHELFRKITNQWTVIPKPVYQGNEALINKYIEKIDSSKGLEKIKLKEKFFQFCVELQIFGKNMFLLRDFPIKSKFLDNYRIKILDSVAYDDKVGLKFVDEKIDNIIG